MRREEFDIRNLLTTLRPYYRGGRYDFLLNSPSEIDLLSKRFIVFEIDAIKDNKELFPIVTIVLMEVFINKMRRLKGIRKMLIIEEAWKALASNNMASYVQYLYKTVRKHFGEVVTVTQEVQDIISSPIVKEAIINNSDCKILLDQRKFMNRFDAIQTLLGLTDKEKAQILSINQSLHPGRKYKEVWIGLGGVQSAVYATEVSKQEYLAYTTEESEKIEVQRRAESLGGDIELAIKQLAEKIVINRGRRPANTENIMSKIISCEQLRRLARHHAGIGEILTETLLSPRSSGTDARDDLRRDTRTLRPSGLRTFRLRTRGIRPRTGSFRGTRRNVRLARRGTPTQGAGDGPPVRQVDVRAEPLRHRDRPRGGALRPQIP